MLLPSVQESPPTFLHPNIAFNIDFSYSELLFRIERHRHCRRNDFGRDLGNEASVVDYFIDNPSQLPQLGEMKKLGEVVLNRDHCRTQQRLEAVLLPLAVSRHQYLMGINLDKPVSGYEAWRDFKLKGYYSDWSVRQTAATCVCLCDYANNCTISKRACCELDRRKSEGLPLIQIF